jgi:hypothetical protein
MTCAHPGARQRVHARGSPARRGGARAALYGLGVLIFPKIAAFAVAASVLSPRGEFTLR